MAAVNLNLGKIKSISRLRFTTTIGGKGGGVLLFKNLDEKNYLLLWQQRSISGGKMAGVSYDNDRYKPIINYRYNRNDSAQVITNAANLKKAESTDGWTGNDTGITWDIVVNNDY